MTEDKKRIIGVTGEKGTGKSSVALNLALAWAGTQSRPVLIVAFPPRGKRRSKRSVDPAALLKLSPARLGRPVIVSPFGVAVADVAPAADPAAVLEEMERLSETYDLFLDVDPAAEMKEAALASCRRVFWLTVPRKRRARDFPSNAELIVNRSRKDDRLDASPVRLPYDRSVPLYDGAGRLLIVERIQSPWIGALRPLLGRVMETLSALN